MPRIGLAATLPVFAVALCGGRAPALGASGALPDPVWVGAPGEAQWRWSRAFARPTHLGLLRAHFGESPTSGVPTVMRWEVRPARGSACEASQPGDDDWTPLEATVQDGALDWPDRAQPTRRSWFVDAEACALRLVVDRTNAGPPILRAVQIVESARDVLLGQAASDDGAAPGFDAGGAVDGTYAGRWAGAPGKGQWTLRVDLAEPVVADRVRLVLGFDATTSARTGPGRDYAVAWAPMSYVLEASDDGARFEPIARQPVLPGGALLPIRRRLVRVAARKVKALRLVMTGATGADGRPDAAGAPVVREIAAYRADDPRPVLASPWILSVNANPPGQSRREVGGEALNDAFHAKFIQRRFASLLEGVRVDDRFARMVGRFGEPRPAPPSDAAGEGIEAIEADDPVLGPELLAGSYPPPIAVLSGSNDWDYAPFTRSDPVRATRWYWDPLRDAKEGGMARLGPAVTGRVAPFLGFCGGAQILALLEARGAERGPGDDQSLIDRVLKRTSGHPVRGFATVKDLLWAWPSDPHPRRARVSFEPADPLFEDLAGSTLRDSTQALPEAHADAIRTDAFLPDGPLRRFEVVAKSRFCAPYVVAASPQDGVSPAPDGRGWCDVVPEAFRSREAGWPVIGTQFHAEQWQFAAPAPGDPPESVDDPRLFMAAAFEEIVDAYVAFEAHPRPDR